MEDRLRRQTILLKIHSTVTKAEQLQQSKAQDKIISLPSVAVKWHINVLNNNKTKKISCDQNLKLWHIFKVLVYSPV